MGSPPAFRDVCESVWPENHAFRIVYDNPSHLSGSCAVSVTAVTRAPSVVGGAVTVISMNNPSVNAGMAGRMVDSFCLRPGLYIGPLTPAGQ